MTILQDVVNYIPSTTEDVINDDLFIANLKLAVDTSLSTLVQNNVGRPISLFTEPDYEWEDFFTDNCPELARLQAKQYVYTQCLLQFDPPQPSVIQILKESASESLWRARLESET